MYAFMARYLIQHMGQINLCRITLLTAPRYLGYAVVTDFFWRWVVGVWLPEFGFAS
jgi:hypothetical protein